MGDDSFSPCMNIVRQKPARVLERRQLTHDSVEFVFEFLDGEKLDYVAGQFVQIMIQHPKEDADWFVVNEGHIYNALSADRGMDVAQIAAHFSCGHEYVEKVLDLLVEQQRVTCSEGQYMKLFVDEPIVIKNRPFMRPYSLGSSPLEKTFSTMIKEVPNGFFSRYTVGLQRLTVGDEILVTGPLGHFSLPDSGVEKLLLIGAGSGITPLMGMIRHTTKNGDAYPVTLLYSNKTEEDIIYREELQHISETFSHVHVVHTLTRVSEAAEWSGKIGRVDTALLQDYGAGEHTHIFICGPLHFAQAMKTLLVEDCNVSPEKIKVEAFG